MQNSSEDESAFSAVTRLPITPFSSFLNDLNRPFFLNNLHPSAEIVRTGVNFPEIVETPDSIPVELFNCSSFNPSKIALNVAPVKVITHDYDDFMLKVLEECYEIQTSHIKEPEMTIPKPNTSTPVKQKASKSFNNNENISTPSALKVKLNVAGTSSNNSLILKKLIQEESFVNPLCFDCEEDLSLIARVISSFSLFPPQSTDLEMFESINETLSKYIEEVIEHLDQSSESIDSVKAAYCMSLIGLLNVGRLSANGLLKDYNSFYLVMKFNTLCLTGSFDLILSVVIESYVALLTRFKIHDTEISSYSTHLFDLCFESSGPLSKTSSIIALSQVFSRYSEYRSYIIEQLLMKSTDAENSEIQKLGATIILTCSQALCSDSSQSNAFNSISSILTSCLSYCWKGEGNELPKSSNIFFALIDELLNVFSNYRWPIAVVALNQCTIQMFHYLLKEESSVQKGSLFLKLRFLDVLANISKVVSSDSEPIEKRSNWLLIGQNSWFASILSPKITFENLNQSVEFSTFDQEFYSKFIRSCPLSKAPERVIGLLIKLISSEVVQLRSKAIKNLFNLMNSLQLCESNYKALKASILMKAADPSISVRDASLDFISKMIFSPLPHDDSSKELIESVISRIKDRGVSVRKRAVKVVGEILMKRIVDGSDMKLACIGNLISHISDEEDEVVVEMILKTLKDQWIMCYLGKDFLTISPAAQRKLMAKFADEVVKVIGFLQSDIKCLQDFLGRFLIDETIKKEYSIFFCGTIEVLLENLLQTLEANDAKSLKRSLESICLFSESNLQSLENHLGLLQNLLRSEDAEISFLAMKLISGIIPMASLSELKKLQDFEKDLLVLIYRGSEVTVKFAIGTLYHYVNNCSHQYSILSGLWQKFTEYLKIRMGDQEIDPSTIPHICRALLATGVLCAQSAIHREKEFGLKDFHNGAQSRCLLEFISIFSRSPVIFIRSCTIQAFGSLLLASPQISISSSHLVRSLIVSTLSESEDDSSKLKMLGIFDQMIKRFNLETETAVSNNNNNSRNNILSMEGEESYFSALIQEHLTLISNCQISSEGLEVQASALKICSSSAILGLVNPQLIIPYLAIGLNSDNDHIQSYSRNSYERLLTRFPSMMSKDLLTPIKLLYRQLMARGKGHLKSGEGASTSGEGALKVEVPLTSCGAPATTDKFSSRLSFYYSSLRGKAGKAGIEALNGVFSWFEEIISSKKEVSIDFDLINFVIEIIFTLPFSNSEEVLNCLQKIQGIFSISLDFSDSSDDYLFLKEKFIILNGFSYSLNYLIKSYPQITGMSIEEGNNQIKTIQRNILSFELPKINETIKIEIETIKNLISSQQLSIPNLLIQLQLPNHKKRQIQDDDDDDDDEEEDADNYSDLLLIDDDEISEDESEDENEHFIEIEEVKKSKNISASIKKHEKSFNKKKNSKKQKKK